MFTLSVCMSARRPGQRFKNIVGSAMRRTFAQFVALRAPLATRRSSDPNVCVMSYGRCFKRLRNDFPLNTRRKKSTSNGLGRWPYTGSGFLPIFLRCSIQVLSSREICVWWHVLASALLGEGFDGKADTSSNEDALKGRRSYV